jgi:hypothetical protein
MKRMTVAVKPQEMAGAALLSMIFLRKRFAFSRGQNRFPFSRIML